MYNIQYLIYFVMKKIFEKGTEERNKRKESLLFSTCVILTRDWCDLGIRNRACAHTPDYRDYTALGIVGSDNSNWEGVVFCLS